MATFTYGSQEESTQSFSDPLIIFRRDEKRQHERQCEAIDFENVSCGC